MSVSFQRSYSYCQQ